MKNILFGIIIGIGLLSSGAFVHAEIIKHQTWYLTDKLNSTGNSYQKIYDENTNIVCYSVNLGSGGGISCLKNN